MALTPAIDISGLCFAHPGRERQLDDITLTIGTGEVACLLGPNGTGKTTLLRCLLGLLQPQAGTAHVAGHDLATTRPRTRAKLVAYVPQTSATVFPFTTLDMAVMGRTPHLPVTATPGRADRAHAHAVLRDLGLAHVAHQPFGSLSGGERALALVARALVQEAEVLILDEPTAALDLGNSVRVLKVVNRLADAGKTVLMTTHQPDHALHVADRAILLAGGRITVDGDPRTDLTSHVLSTAYGTPVQVIPTPVPGLDTPTLTCVAIDSLRTRSINPLNDQEDSPCSPTPSRHAL